MLRPIRPYPGTCPATVLRLCPDTRRATAHCPATVWWGLTASAVWRVLFMTGPSPLLPLMLSLQQRRGGQWGMTPCGSCMSGSRGRPSLGKVWLSRQVDRYTPCPAVTAMMGQFSHVNSLYLQSISLPEKTIILTANHQTFWTCLTWQMKYNKYHCTLYLLFIYLISCLSVPFKLTS